MECNHIFIENETGKKMKNLEGKKTWESRRIQEKENSKKFKGEKFKRKSKHKIVSKIEETENWKK